LFWGSPAIFDAEGGGVENLEERVRSLVEPVLARHGADLVEVQVRRGRTQLVRIVADRPGGIDLETCARVSDELSRLLDVDDTIEGRYTLEVTSPGLDRPLRTPEDFRKNLGRKVKVIQARNQMEGIVKEVGQDRVWLDRDGERIEMPLAEIVKATLVLPW
jgi:ribosome maturation factor RimP